MHDTDKKEPYDVPPKPLTIHEILKGCEDISDETGARVCRITNEFTFSLDYIKSIDRSVSFFGSSRLPETDEHYQAACQLAERISKELGYAIVTGGGPGIMEAANRGAYTAGGRSIGFTIQLATEQKSNKYLTEAVPFYYFFSRKVALSFAAEAYIFFPGGFGTLDEFFEILTLIQTKKIQSVPLILVGSDYWKPLDDFIKDHLLNEHETISKGDEKLYTITDDQDEIIEIVRNAPEART